MIYGDNIIMFAILDFCLKCAMERDSVSSDCHQALYFQPRDMFVTKLMKKLKVTATTEKDVEDKEEEEDVEESWEDLASDEVRRSHGKTSQVMR